MAAKTSVKSASKPAGNIKSASLYQWNKYLALILAAQGLIILVLSVKRVYAVGLSFLGVDTLQSQAQGQTVLAAGMHPWFDVNLAFVVATFLFISAIAYGLLATRWRSMYERDLQKGLNRARWIQFSLSGGIMLVVIGLLVGVQDFSALLMLFGLIVLANLLGYVMEIQNQGVRKTNWLSGWLAATAGTVSCLVILVYTIADVLYGATPAAYVFWVLASMLVLAGCFVTNFYLQFRKTDKWANYLFAERNYMILSLAGQTLLAWLIFAGTLHP